MDVYGDFRIDDLLDFTNDDLFSSTSYSSADTSSMDHYCPLLPNNSASTTNATINQTHHNFFSADLCFPSDNDVAELEWLSNIVGDDDSGVDLATASDMSLYSGTTSANEARSSRGKRSKRTSPSPAGVAAAAAGGSGGRRCTHCLSEKTPQWRSGPMGPKTLCNACGVRFKSGRLVPEYRPAASPTFVLTQHSNSHRKVLELRRQKEHLVSHQNQSDQQGHFYHGFRVC